MKKLLFLIFILFYSFAYADIFGPVDELRYLLDVNITSPANNDALTYDSATSKWVNSGTDYQTLLVNSAGLAAALSDEIGNAGFAVFSDSPVFTTQITTPLIVSPAANNLTLTPPSGYDVVANVSGVAGEFIVGTNEFIVNVNSDAVSIGTTSLLANGLWMADSGGIQIGSNGADGKLILYSEQGGTDYTATLFTHTAMTSSANFYLPADEPAGTYLLNMTSGGVMGFDSTSYAPLASPTFSGLVTNSTDDAITNTVTELYRLTHTSSGTVAASFGASIDTYLEDASGNAAQQASSIATIWTDATDASEDSAITFSGVSAGGALTEWGRFYGATVGTGGQLKIIQNSIANQQSPGVTLSNDTLSTASVTVQQPPVIILTGHAWVSGADSQTDHRIRSDNGNTSNPNFNIDLREAIGTWRTLFTIDQNGDFVTPISTTKWDTRETLVIGAKLNADANATATYDQYSPYFRIFGKGWKTAATAGTQDMSLGFVVAPEQGVTNPIGVFKYFYGTNSSTPTESNELIRYEWGDRLGIVFNEQSLNSYNFRIETDANANAFIVDGANEEVKIGAELVYTPSTTQNITAVSNTILGNGTIIVLNPDADYTLTSAPTISDGTTGQILYITCANGEANTVTVQDQDSLASSNLQLGAASRAISGKDVLCLMFDGTDWIEVSFANN